MDVVDTGRNSRPESGRGATQGTAPPIDIITDQVGEYRPVFMPFQHLGSHRSSRSRKLRKSERKKQAGSARNQNVSHPTPGGLADLEAALGDDELLEVLRGVPGLKGAAGRDLDQSAQAPPGEERRMKAEQRRNSQNLTTRRLRELNAGS